MATTKRRTKRNKTRDKLIVYGILSAFLFVGFVLGFIMGRLTIVHKVSAPVVEETVFAAELENAVVTEAVNVEKVEPEEVVYFDCPLSEELQDYIFEVCEEEAIPPSLVIAVIDHESDFTSDAISYTADYGLMQINECNHEWLSETYGITDFLDPQQNILGGIKILASLYHKYDNPHEIAMAYNMGESGAETARENGVTSTSYSEDVVSLWYMYEVDHEMEVQRGKSND